MAAALLVVVVAFSWAHSTARVSRGLGLTHPHAACVGEREREVERQREDGEERATRFAKSSIKCITRGDGTGHRDGVCLIYFDARRGSTSCRSRPFLILSTLSRWDRLCPLSRWRIAGCVSRIGRYSKVFLASRITIQVTCFVEFL